MLAFDSVTKDYGNTRAVEQVSFGLQPGRVLGLVGPNGAGKTTLIHIALGLVRPTAGIVSFKGRNRITGAHPREIGVAFGELRALPYISGRRHLEIAVAASGIASVRLDEVLELVGLADAGRKLIRDYSLGMRQRLSLATAILGDPEVLILDEPGNGLDPEGVVWLRNFICQLAAEGRCVALSSHDLGEVQKVAQDVVILNQRVLFAGSMAELRERNDALVVRSADNARLATLMRAAGATVVHDDTALRVIGMTLPDVSALASTNEIELLSLSAEATLERSFFELLASERVATEAQQ